MVSSQFRETKNSSSIYFCSYLNFTLIIRSRCTFMNKFSRHNNYTSRGGDHAFELNAL